MMKAHPSLPSRLRSTAAFMAALATALGGTTPAVHAQTITGRLLDLETDQPIDLGLVIMVSEAGDSVASTVTSPNGFFSLASPEPGSFSLLGSAWGYPEAREGAFDLGAGGSMRVVFRLRAEPLPMEEIFVGVDRPTFDHPLVRNGFVRRYQRGLGHFITPRDIQTSLAPTTEALFVGIPGVVSRPPAGANASLAYLGDIVKMRDATGGLCDPSVYVDGARTRVDWRSGLSLSMVVPLQAVEAVEVYRRPAEVPVEYGVTQGSNASMGGCGVIAFWTKSGPALGAAADGGAPPAAPSVPGAGRLAGMGSLPAVDDAGPPPEPGERIRMELSAQAAADAGLASPWAATFRGVRGGQLVTGDPELLERPVTVPLGEIEALQVLRERDRGRVWRRGLVAGALFGGGVWLGLRTLCQWTGCPDDNQVLPAVGIGLLAGLLVAGQGPGERWVAAPVPGPEGGLGAGLSWRVPIFRE